MLLSDEWFRMSILDNQWWFCHMLFSNKHFRSLGYQASIYTFRIEYARGVLALWFVVVYHYFVADLCKRCSHILQDNFTGTWITWTYLSAIGVSLTHMGKIIRFLSTTKYYKARTMWKRCTVFFEFIVSLLPPYIYLCMYWEKRKWYTLTEIIMQPPSEIQF